MEDDRKLLNLEFETLEEYLTLDTLLVLIFGGKLTSNEIDEVSGNKINGTG